MDEDLNKRVEFQDDYVSRSYGDFDNPSKMVSFVKKYSGGLIKDEEQASRVLIGFVVVAIVISLFLIFSGGGKQQPKLNINPETGQEIIPGQVPGEI